MTLLGVLLWRNILKEEAKSKIFRRKVSENWDMSKFIAFWDPIEINLHSDRGSKRSSENFLEKTKTTNNNKDETERCLNWILSLYPWGWRLKPWWWKINLFSFGKMSLTIEINHCTRNYWILRTIKFLIPGLKT